MIAHTSHLVGPLLRHALERDLDVSLERFGLDETALARDESAIGEVQLGQLFDEIALGLGEPNLGLVLPGRLRFERYAIPELAARASATLREAMHQWSRYASLLHPAVEFVFEETRERARWSQRALGHPRGLSRHLNEFALAAAVHFSRETSRTGPRVLEVAFVHARPRALEPLREYFGTEALSFGALANTLVMDPSSLDQPQHTADARLLATIESIGLASLEQSPRAPDSVREAVARRLVVQLERGEVRVRGIARELAMSVRTLQRRLEEEGASFASILDEVRCGVACDLVRRRDLSLTEVSSRLGFAEFSTFSRAFKRWTGLAPGAYRDHQQPFARALGSSSSRDDIVAISQSRCRRDRP